MTRSPGSAQATCTALPLSRCPIPRPSRARASIAISNGFLLRRATPLLLPPAATRLLVPPAVAGALGPLPGKHLADPAFPFRMPIGHGDLPIDRARIPVLVRDRLVHRYPFRQRDRAGIADLHRAVPAEAERAAVEMRTQRVAEPVAHPRADGINRRRADGDVRSLRD